MRQKRAMRAASSLSVLLRRSSALAEGVDLFWVDDADLDAEAVQEDGEIEAIIAGGFHAGMQAGAAAGDVSFEPGVQFVEPCLIVGQVECGRSVVVEEMGVDFCFTDIKTENGHGEASLGKRWRPSQVFLAIRLPSRAEAPHTVRPRGAGCGGPGSFLQDRPRSNARSPPQFQSLASAEEHSKLTRSKRLLSLLSRRFLQRVSKGTKVLVGVPEKNRRFAYGNVARNVDRDDDVAPFLPSQAAGAPGWKCCRASGWHRRARR